MGFNSEPDQIGFLGPGTFEIGVLVEDGRYGILRDVVIRSGEETHVTVPIRPTNARLRVTAEAPLILSGIEVYFEGVLMARIKSQAVSHELAVPPGRITLRTIGEPSMEATVEIAEMGLTEFVFAR